MKRPLHNGVLKLELDALARSFLCHSERSEETRIFLGAKHFDFSEGTRSRAAPNSICSYAKLPMKEAIWRIGRFAIAISALVSIAAGAGAQMRPMMIPVSTTLVITKPEPGQIFGSKQVVTMGVGAKIYTFLLKDAYVDDSRGKVRWPDVWQLVRQYRPNFNVTGLGEDTFEKMEPGETMTVRGMFSANNQTFQVMRAVPGEGGFDPGR